MFRQIALFAPAIALVSLAGCEGAKPVYVDGASVRLNANPDNPAAAYFTIHGGSAGVTLRGVETDAAVKLEMHESMMHDGMMSMMPIDTVDVPAGATVAFAPAGKHVMLWKINPQAVAAGKMQFRFIFSNGDRIVVDAVVQGPDGKPTGTGQAPTAGTTTTETVEH
jgi:copper(I)-binding protein